MKKITFFASLKSLKKVVGSGSVILTVDGSGSATLLGGKKKVQLIKIYLGLCVYQLTEAARGGEVGIGPGPYTGISYHCPFNSGAGCVGTRAPGEPDSARTACALRPAAAHEPGPAPSSRPPPAPSTHP
jgi:hypothetical protein